MPRQISRPAPDATVGIFLGFLLATGEWRACGWAHVARPPRSWCCCTAWACLARCARTAVMQSLRCLSRRALPSTGASCFTASCISISLAWVASHMHKDVFVSITSAGLAKCREPLLNLTICQSTTVGACCVREILMQFSSAQQVMGIWSGLVGMSGGYVATALVMLMSPVFFPVLAIIAPVRSSVGRCFSGDRLMPQLLYTASTPTHCWVFWHPILCLKSSKENLFVSAKMHAAAAPAAQRD